MTAASPLLANTNTAERIASIQREISRTQEYISEAELLGVGHQDWVVALRADLRRLQADLAYYENRFALETAGSPSLQLLSPQTVTLEPGTSQEVTVTFRNVGTREMRNLFTIAAPSPNSPFTVAFLNNSNSIQLINSNQQRTMTLYITANENAAVGNYSFALNHFFTDHLGATATASHSINVRIGGVEGEPDVRLSNFQTMHTGPVLPGQTFTVSATIQNLGEAAARNVRIELPNNSLAADGIFITSDLNLVPPNLAAGASSMLNFTFQASSAIETGAHTIEFRVSFTDDSGTHFPPVTPGSTPIRSFFTLNAYAPDDDVNIPTLEIRDMTAPVGAVRVGQNGRIGFYLHNTGDVDARNIFVEVSPRNDRVLVPTSAPIQVIPNLAPGQSRRVYFDLSPEEAGARPRSEAVRFRVSFTVSGESISFDQYGHLNIYDPAADEDERAGQIPRVIVSEHMVYPAIPRAGEHFELTVTFRNTNAQIAVNNVRVRLEEVTSTATGPMGQVISQFAGFLPVDGSDTLFVDHLPPLGEVTKVLRYSTSMDATPGTHNLRVNFDYQDADFAEHTANQLITITVAQMARLEIANVNMPEFASVGSPVWFSFQVINSGRVNLSSVRLFTSGPFDVSGAGGTQGAFHGNLNLQRTLDATGDFIPLEPGLHTGTFLVQAEDNTGAIVYVEHDFNIMVEGGLDMGDWDGDFHHGGDWPGAWDGGDGMMVRPMPDGGFGGGMFDGGWGMEEEDESGAVSRFFRHVFRREVAPYWWDDDAMGGDFATMGSMMGHEAEVRTRWWAVGLTALGVIVVIATPILIVKHVKRQRLLMDFDNEE